MRARFGNTGHVATRKRTVAERTADMAMFLYGCTDDRLAHVSADELAMRHGLDRKFCEYSLALARQRRG